MALRGLFAIPFLLYIAAFMELIGALSLILGYKTKWGAGLLIIFLIPVTLLMHNFWAAPEEAFKLEMIHFMSNLSILGGLLYVVAAGPGKLSLDEK